jgi:hypothetical protein
MEPVGARLGSPSAPGSPQWREFFEQLFAGRGWEELNEIFHGHGGWVTPFTDYPHLDNHPQIKALKPFEPFRVDGETTRVVRVPWRMSSYPQGFKYEYAARSTGVAEPAAVAASAK